MENKGEAEEENTNCSQKTKISREKSNKISDVDGIENDMVSLKICQKCSSPIEKTQSFMRLQNSGKFYHSDHFTCSTCSCDLRKCAFKVFLSELFCMEHYLKAIEDQKKGNSDGNESSDVNFCGACNKVASSASGQKIMIAIGLRWHSECFRCNICNCKFKNNTFFEFEGKPVCEIHRRGLLNCAKCEKQIDEVPIFRAGKSYHKNCSSCVICKRKKPPSDVCDSKNETSNIDEASLFNNQQQKRFYLNENNFYCVEHYKRLLAPICCRCTSACLENHYVVNEEYYHKECLSCEICDTKLKSYMKSHGYLVCDVCYKTVEDPCCDVCKDTIDTGKNGHHAVIRCCGKKVHNLCLFCAFCKKALDKKSARLKGDYICCNICLFSKKCSIPWYLLPFDPSLEPIEIDDDIEEENDNENNKNYSDNNSDSDSESERNVSEEKTKSEEKIEKSSIKANTSIYAHPVQNRSSNALLQTTVKRGVVQYCDDENMNGLLHVGNAKHRAKSVDVDERKLHKTDEISSSIIIKESSEECRFNDFLDANDIKSQNNINTNSKENKNQNRHMNHKPHASWAAAGFKNQLKDESATFQWTKGNLIGAGGFGKVYMGMVAKTGELIAVKQATFEENKELEVRALVTEIELMKGLSHKNIVKLLGTEIKGNKLNILMEYIPGSSIHDLIERFGPLNEDLIKSYTRQICRALEYCHRNHVIHRDIKGRNVLVDQFGTVKLADFGSAKRSSDMVHNAVSLGFTYTPLWTAPEVLSGNETSDNLYNNKIDIWSLGCVIIEMATGKPPWSEKEFENPWRALYHIGRENELPVLPDNLSEDGIKFLEKCLTRNPEKRPSASELLKGMESQSGDLLCIL